MLFIPHEKPPRPPVDAAIDLTDTEHIVFYRGYECILTPYGIVAVTRSGRLSGWPPSSSYEIVLGGVWYSRMFERVYHDDELMKHIALNFAMEKANVNPNDE